MPRYMVVRTFTVNAEEMPVVGRRSRVLAEEQFPQIVWEHSHVTRRRRGRGSDLLRLRGARRGRSSASTRQQLGQHTIDSIHEIAGDVTPADFPG